MTTKQRKIILAELKQKYSHPTADELYSLVKQKIPNISLATVYRNLNLLAENGEILKLGHAGQQQRFDANLTNHYHLICKECGKIYDIKADKVSAIKHSIINHQVQGYFLEFYGICATCKQQGEKND